MGPSVSGILKAAGKTSCLISQCVA